MSEPRQSRARGAAARGGRYRRPATALAAGLLAWAGLSAGAGAQTDILTEPKKNVWYHHDVTGFDIYGVINDDGDRFEFSCDVAYSPKGGATAMLTISRAEPPPRTIVFVQIDQNSYQFSIDNNRVVRTDCQACAEDYKAIWRAVRSGRWMTLKLKDGLSASFPLRGAARVVPKTPCKPDYDRVQRKPEANPEGYPYPATNTFVPPQSGTAASSGSGTSTQN